VSVLARLVEASGIPTVLVTMMPDVAEWLLVPRIVGVEFPFGHSFGPAGDEVVHRRVLETAVVVLGGSTSFGTRVDIDLEWPTTRGEAYKSWQPAAPSPIVQMMLDQRGNS